jgi:hypothetical protein
MKQTLIMVGTIFVLSPIPGNIAGAWYVQSQLGGYKDYVAGMRFTTLMSVMAFGSCLMLTAAAMLKIRWGTKNIHEVWLLYVIAFFSFLFFGAAPTAVINGTAVSKVSISSRQLNLGIHPMLIPILSGVFRSVFSPAHLLLARVSNFHFKTLGGL